MAAASISDQFNALAGAHYGVFGIRNGGRVDQGASGVDSHPLTKAQFAWMVVSQVLARHDEPQQAWRDLARQMQIAAFFRPEAFDKLSETVRESWSVVSAFLLLPDELRQAYAETYLNSSFAAEQHSMISRLLLALIDRYGGNLFFPGQWLADVKNESRYSTTEQALVVKLGLTLRWLAESASGSERSMWERWQQQLKSEVLHVLPQRIARGFAPEAPHFEDVVLALLAVAEWLSYEKQWRIHDFLADTDQRDSERLSDDQKVIAGAYYGYIRGYREIGNSIANLSQRAAIARQATCLASRLVEPLTPMGTSPFVFYGSEAGTLSGFQQPYIVGTSLTETEHIATGTNGDAQTSRAIELHIEVAQGAYAYDVIS